MLTENEVLQTPLQQWQHRSKYARWREDLGRRETWRETGQRYTSFMRERTEGAISANRWHELEQSIYALEVIPSMRALMTAGPALAKDEVAGYNCSYLTISRPEAWDEMMYLLMCGVGVGYSVEDTYTSKLPHVPGQLHDVDDVIVVSDSKIGWASGLRRLVKTLYSGFVPRWDLSRIRPAGAVLRTFGGRASGPDPLDRLMNHIVSIFRRAQGRRLSNVECHSICCMVGDIVVVGGVRRSAMIALFGEDDYEMLTLKMGKWFDFAPHLGMANNSQVTHGRPPIGKFMHMWTTLVEGQSGEPGICNRTALQEQASRWGRRAYDVDYGMNPCGEIILRDRQLCNLSSAIARPTDDLSTLMRKYRAAVALGVAQATLTSFRYLSPQWQRNCEDERLLGASLDGIPDHPVLNGSQGEDERTRWQVALRETGRREAEGLADRLQIAVPAAIGALKPAGNSSVLTGAASPLKAHHAPFYVRRTRGNVSDPVTQHLMAQGVPHEPEAWHPDTTVVFSWPVRAPDGALTRHDWSALRQLEQWLSWHENFCEHKPSVTVNVKPHEWLDVASFIYEHFDKMSGVAFLPDENHSYVQAPYEELTEREYWDLTGQMPDIDWESLAELENEDMTTAARELSCSAGSCDLV